MLQPLVTKAQGLFKMGFAMSPRAGIQIGELSKRTKCNIEAIRYYERIALLPAPARSAGRYSEDVRRLTFIRRARRFYTRRRARVVDAR